MFTCQEIKQLEGMKAERLARCKTYKCCNVYTKGFYCGSCRRLSQKMCKKYHILKDDQEHLPEASLLAYMEIKERLKFEYVFGIISLRDIYEDKWDLCKGREKGHQLRISKLLSIMET